jgi:homopolymeric O-antigen transport system permease protein
MGRGVIAGDPGDIPGKIPVQPLERCYYPAATPTGQLAEIASNDPPHACDTGGARAESRHVFNINHPKDQLARSRLSRDPQLQRNPDLSLNLTSQEVALSEIAAGAARAAASVGEMAEAVHAAEATDAASATASRHADQHAVRPPVLRIRPSSGWAALQLNDVWQFRDLLLALAARDVKLRYKQTVLGISWVLLQPLLAAGIFSFVFGTVAGIKAGEKTPYFLFSYAGLLAWNLFSNTLTRCSTCLVGNAQLISKVFFPRLVLPLSTVPSALIDFAVALAMMAVLLATWRLAPGPQLLLFPLWLVLLLLISAGIGLWTAALSVSYRDVQYILPVFLQLLLYACPIAYPVSKVPARFFTLFHLNPMASIITGMRWSLLNEADAPHWPFVAYSAAVALALAFSGAFAFKRMERKFADVI